MLKLNQMKVGAILSYISILLNIIIALVYTPITIRLLGQSEYGLYSIIGPIVAYFSIMDMGLGNAIVRYIARNRVLGNKQIESKLNSIFLLLYGLIAILTILIGMIVYFNADNIFNSSLTSEELNKVKIMILLVILNFAISFPLAIFSSIIQAYEKFILIKIVSIVRYILIPCLTLPFISIGYGSLSMVLITTIINILCLLFNTIYCIKFIKVSFYFGKLDRKLLLEIISYSFFILLNVIVDLIYWNSGQIILGIVSGPESVAIFAVAIQFIKLFMMFSTSISGVFLPKITMMVANKATSKELTEFMVKIGRLQYLILALILSGFIIFGLPFIKIWAGAEYSDAFYISLIMMIPLTIPLIQNVGISILQAKSLNGFRSVITLLVAIISITISFPLASRYFGSGAALATSFSLIIGNIIIMNIYYHYKIKLDMVVFWKNIFVMTIPIIIITIIGYVMNLFVSQQSIIAISFKVCLFTIFYGIIMWFIGMNTFEKNLFSLLLKKIYAPINKFYIKVKA